MQKKGGKNNDRKKLTLNDYIRMMDSGGNDADDCEDLELDEYDKY